MPTTYAEAHAIEGGAYRLARMWVDAPVRDGSAERELSELAVMSALTDWLKRWLPIHIHGAVEAGATMEQIEAATGHIATLIREVWRNWATGQRHLYEHTRNDPDLAALKVPLGLTVEAYDRVAQVLGCPPWSTD